MQIIRNTGNVTFLNDNGDIYKIVPSDAVIDVIDTQNLQLKFGQEMVRINASSVTFTKTLTGSLTPFTGNANDLAIILQDIFFFEVTGGGGGGDDLKTVLSVGNSAGTYNIDMNLRNIDNVKIVDFDSLSTTDPAVGGLAWNDVFGTLSIGLKGGNIKNKIGQQEFVRIVNKTVPNIDLFRVNYQVCIVAGATGQRLSVRLAKADSDINSAGTIGVVAEDILKNQEGFLATFGEIDNINTSGSLQGETWADGDVLYLSPFTAGGITNIKPSAPNHLVTIGYVAYAAASKGKIFVKIDNGYELNELHDVAYPTTPANNESLVYNLSNNRWENKKLQLSDVLLSGNSAGSVPINLNNQDLQNADKISFNTTTVDTGGVAQLKWNDNDGTLDLGLKGGNVNLQIGQESVIRVNNQTSPAITLNEAAYQAVIVTGAVSGKLAVKLAQANSDINSFTTIGIVTETILHGSEGFITTYGLVRGIDTTGSLQGETWADGDILYLSPTVLGGITKVRPISPNNIITIGYVANTNAVSGSIFVKVDNLGYISSGNNFILEASTQWSKTLPGPVTLNNATTANGFTFFDDSTDRVANGCTNYCEFFISYTRKITLTGTSGTANINVGGVNYLATFTTSLAGTASAFVATHGAAILAATGIKVAAVSNVIRFGDDITTLLNAITITNVTTNLNGTLDTTIGDHVVIPYIGTPYAGLRLSHMFRVNFNIVIGSDQNYALSLRRWVDDSIIGSEIPITRNADVAGVQETFLSYTAGALDAFVTGGFYFALRNDSGQTAQIDGNVGILILTTFQKPVNF